MSFFLIKEEVENAVWDFIKSATQYPDSNITFAKTNRIRPEDPYITIRFLNAERYAKGRIIGYTNNCEEKVVADYRIQFEVAAFREDRDNQIDPLSTCMQITHATAQTEHAEILCNAKVGFSDSTNIIDISSVRDGAIWEQAYSFIFTFNIAVLEINSNPSYIIDTVNMEMNLLDTDDTLIAQENISVNFN
jgi:hypothetical protein